METATQPTLESSSGGQAAIPVTASTLQSIPIDQLHPNPWNRKQFDPQLMEELAQAIKADGVQVRLIVRPRQAGGYEIVDGERRWRAAQGAGLKEVPCEVRDFADEQVAEMDILVNIQREDLPPLELARMLAAFMEQYNKNQKETATLFGKTEGWVSQYKGYLTLHPDLKNFTAVKFSTGDLRSLKQLTLDQQQQVAKELKDGSLKPELIQKRCNQLRFAGSRPPKAKVGQTEEALPDPLVDLWPILAAQSSASGLGFWGVTYGNNPIPSMNGVSMPGWQFWICNQGVTPESHLKEWLRMLLEGLSAKESTADFSNDSPKNLGGISPQIQDVTQTQEYKEWKATHPDQYKAMMEKVESLKAQAKAKHSTES